MRVAREAPLNTVVLFVVVVRLEIVEEVALTMVALWYDVLMLYEVSYWVT